MFNNGNDVWGSTNVMSNMPALGFDNAVWLIISLILSFIGCFFIYFMFVKKDGKEKNKYLAWLKSFLRFDNMLIENILKIDYRFAALFITLSSFAVIGTSFLGFLTTLIFGNLITRIVYEFALIIIMIWKNTTEIKNKTK